MNIFLTLRAHFQFLLACYDQSYPSSSYKGNMFCKTYVMHLFKPRISLLGLVAIARDGNYFIAKSMCNKITIKALYGKMQTAKAQTSIRINAVRSGPLLLAVCFVQSQNYFARKQRCLLSGILLFCAFAHAVPHISYLP